MAEEEKKQENAKEEKKPAEAKPETKAEAKAEAKPDEPKAEAKPKVKLSKDMENVIKMVESMTVLELSELVKALEDKFGVSAAAPAAIVAASGASAAAGAPEAEEKSVFTVVLSEIGANKIQVIKEIRALTNLGLKEAKDLVESAPKEIKADLPKDEAEKMKKQVEAAGAKVELK